MLHDFCRISGFSVISNPSFGTTLSPQSKAKTGHLPSASAFMLATLTLSYQGHNWSLRGPGRGTSKPARCCSMTSSYAFPGPGSPRNEAPTEPLPRPRPPTRKLNKQDLPLPISIPAPPPQSQRDAEGRSLAGRKKPLKINLDLALVSIFRRHILLLLLLLVVSLRL